MMEDWTDIIGEELESIEEPLPADDWSVLQQKYAASRRRKRAAFFAWAGGITSVAAAVALVLLLVHPDTSSVFPDSTESINGPVAEMIPPAEEIIQVESAVLLAPADTATDAVPSTQQKISVPDDLVKKADDDVFIAENRTDELLADAAQPAGTFGFEDFPEDRPRLTRRRISIGISGAASDSPVMNKFDAAVPEPPLDSEPPYTGGLGKDSIAVETPQQIMTMMKARGGYTDSYHHEIPVSVGVSARFFLTDRLSINTGLNYTRYKSLRTRTFVGTYDQKKDWQYVHYLGVPVRLDYMAVNRKHFNLYFGTGLKMNKCAYAKVGDERLHEKQLLFDLNGAMGLQVNIVPMVGLYLEPEVSYALNKGSIVTFRSDEPYVITVRAGLRFNF